MTKVYLCGAINGCTDKECRDWREEVKKYFPNSIDPMRRDYRGKETQYFTEIVELDKIDVSASDIILVNYNKPSVGTSMEMLYAWERGKPIILWCPENEILSPWLRYHSHVIVHSLYSAIRKIELILDTERKSSWV